MKALIKDNKVVDVQENEFDVHPDFVWVDCGETVEIGYEYNGTEFISTDMSEEEIAATKELVAQKEAIKASGYQKLIDLGLTAEEASALARYVPPAE